MFKVFLNQNCVFVLSPQNINPSTKCMIISVLECSDQRLNFQILLVMRKKINSLL